MERNTKQHRTEIKEKYGAVAGIAQPDKAV
jgi:hypothetical protein